MAVRAKPTTGFRSGKAAISGRRINPVARRAGATSSSALQIVGVSNALRGSRSATCGRLGMKASSDYRRPPPAFIEKDVLRQALPAARVTGLLLPLTADSGPFDQQSKRDGEGNDDQRDREAALGTAPFLPIRDQIMHSSAPR